jgi:hypothetical protein
MADEPIKELEPRIRTLENRLIALRAGVLTLAACSVAFLGIEYLRIPSAVHSAIKERIDETTLHDIIEAKGIADALIKSSKDNHDWSDKEKEGFVIVGSTLICFGTHLTTVPPSAVWTRKFSFTFPHVFASPPAVTITCVTKGDGYTFGIYKGFTSTAEGCEGLLDEASRHWESGHGDLAAANAEVSVTYVAIGPWAVSAVPNQAN